MNIKIQNIILQELQTLTIKYKNNPNLVIDDPILTRIRSLQEKVVVKDFHQDKKDKVYQMSLKICELLEQELSNKKLNYFEQLDSSELNLQEIYQDLKHLDSPPPGSNIVLKALDEYHRISQENISLLKKLASCESTIEKLRIGFYKQLNSHVPFYDGTVDLKLPKEQQKLFDDKISQLANDYNKRLKALSDHNQKNYVQLQKYRIMASKGGLDLNKLNPKAMVAQMLIVTENPEVIWNAFEDNKPGFFNEYLKKKYKIGPEFHEWFENEFNEKIRKIEQEWKQKLYKTRDQYYSQINIGNEYAAQAEIQIRNLMLENHTQIEVLSREIDEKLFQKASEFNESELKYVQYRFQKEQCISSKYQRKLLDCNILLQESEQQLLITKRNLDQKISGCANDNKKLHIQGKYIEYMETYVMLLNDFLTKNHLEYPKLSQFQLQPLEKLNELAVQSYQNLAKLDTYQSVIAFQKHEMQSQTDLRNVKKTLLQHHNEFNYIQVPTKDNESQTQIRKYRQQGCQNEKTITISRHIQTDKVQDPDTLKRPSKIMEALGKRIQLLHDKNIPKIPLKRLDGLRDEGNSPLSDSFRTENCESNQMTPKRMIKTVDKLIDFNEDHGIFNIDIAKEKSPEKKNPYENKQTKKNLNILNKKRSLNIPKSKKVFQVTPYNIGSMEKFLISRIEKSKMKNQETQTESQHQIVNNQNNTFVIFSKHQAKSSRNINKNLVIENDYGGTTFENILRGSNSVKVGSNKSYVTIKQKQFSNDSISSKLSNNSFKTRRIKKKIIWPVQEYNDPKGTNERPNSEDLKDILKI